MSTEIRVRVERLSPEDHGYFSVGSTGALVELEEENQFWVQFEPGQSGVDYHLGGCWYIGELAALEDKVSFLVSHTDFSRLLQIF